MKQLLIIFTIFMGLLWGGTNTKKHIDGVKGFKFLTPNTVIVGDIKSSGLEYTRADASTRYVLTVSDFSYLGQKREIQLNFIKNKGIGGAPSLKPYFNKDVLYMVEVTLDNYKTLEQVVKLSENIQKTTDLTFVKRKDERAAELSQTLTHCLQNEDVVMELSFVRVNVGYWIEKGHIKMFSRRVYEDIYGLLDDKKDAVNDM